MTGVARLRQASADGRRAEMLVPPVPRTLAAHVADWAEYTEYAPETLCRLEPPGPAATVILTFGPGLVVGGRQLASSFVAPLHLRPVGTAFRGDQHGIQRTLRPLGAAGLLGVPLSALPGVVPLDELADRWWACLAERLAATPWWADRFDLLAASLLDRLGRMRPPHPLVARAWQAFASTHGTVTVAAVAERLGCSRRHLTDVFTAEMGVSPKAAARLLRFERPGALLRTRPARPGPRRRRCGLLRPRAHGEGLPRPRRPGTGRLRRTDVLARLATLRLTPPHISTRAVPRDAEGATDRHSSKTGPRAAAYGAR